MKRFFLLGLLVAHTTQVFGAESIFPARRRVAELERELVQKNKVIAQQNDELQNLRSALTLLEQEFENAPAEEIDMMQAELATISSKEKVGYAVAGACLATLVTILINVASTNE